MIRKINILKDFGIYQNFAWAQLDEFNKKNLIYGWNYSGKTTLSKLFENLEFTDCNRHFNGNEFSVEFENNNTRKTITHSSVHECPNKIKTFNSEYIKRIFTWETPETGIEPISFYLGDPAGNLVAEITLLESKNSRLSVIRDDRYKKIVTEFTQYNKASGKFSSQAKEIREDYLPRLLQQHEFNKGHFYNRLDEIKSDLDSHILTEEVKNTTRDEALAQQEHGEIAEVPLINEELTTIGDRVSTLLRDSAPRAIDFTNLDSNQDLFNWVQDGLELHKESQTCHFCTNQIPENRISELNTYYSNKLKEIQDEIENIQSLINGEKSKLDLTLENELKISELSRTEYTLALSIYEVEKTKYLSQLAIFEKDLTLKKSSLFNSLEPSQYEIVTTKTQIDKINLVIKKHNDWVNEFAERKQIATDKILNHYVAEYAKEEDYLGKEKQNNSAIQTIRTIDSIINNNKSEIRTKNSQLSDMVKGAEELNATLKLLLNRDDIKIEIENEKFTLKRNDFTATNLSEGEKSAIAFSYFLTELKSMKEDSSLPNTIIFIDDPISSLDSNHIFQVRSLIQNFFKENEFGQLFISTHSFEFLSVLFDTKMFGRIQSNSGEHKRPLYFIQRTKDNCATIKKLPKAFSSYKSEYVGLFKIINEYNNSSDKENFPHLLILPNAVRRFLELYTLMRYPTEQEVDNRVKEVFDSGDQTYHSTKLLHWFSHQNKFEMVQNHDDKLLQISEAIEELFNYIKNEDELHWKGLTEQA